MAYTRGEGKTSLGVFIDGLDVKFVHLSLRNKQLHLHDFKTVTLTSKLEDRQAGGEAAPGLESLDLLDAGVEAQLGTEGVGDTESSIEKNGNIILGLIADFPPRQYEFVYSITEPSVYYQTFEDNFGLHGTKLKKRLVEEIAQIRATRPNMDSVAYVDAADGQILSIVREDGMSLLTMLERIQDFIGKRLPKIPFIETSDVSLMNIIRANYDIGPEEISIIVYVGSEFSRLIFIKGKNFYHFAPIISEGRNSSNIENTIYSRILLEQDSAGILHIDRIFLAGEAHKVQLRQFLAPQFAEAPIEYLVPVNLDTGELQESVNEIISEYAIPISAAIRALEQKNPNFYDIDLLPASVREGQKTFKLGWHGYLFMLLIFAGTLFFTNKVADQADDVRQAYRELNQKQLQLAENQRLQGILDNLTGQNQQFRSALAIYDSIVPDYNRWSKMLFNITNSVEDVKSLWIESITARADSAIELVGYTVNRDRIPRIASMFEKATLQSVESEDIRGMQVYKFLLIVQNTDKDK